MNCDVNKRIKATWCHYIKKLFHQFSDKPVPEEDVLEKEVESVMKSKKNKKSKKVQPIFFYK